MLQFPMMTAFTLLMPTCSKYYGQPPNPEAYKAYLSELETKLDGYEKILAKSKYVVGDVRFNPCPDFENG